MEGSRIPMEGLLNTRDLGGYVTADKKTVIPGRLIRSGALAHMTEADRKVLFEEYKVRTVIDFRTKLEASQSPEPKVKGVEFLFCPILNEETAGFTHEGEEGALSDGRQDDEAKAAQEEWEESFLKHVKLLNGNPQSYIDKLYQSLVMNPQAVRQYGLFLNTVADAQEGAVLWHCSAGKDRAGVGTALLLSVLGVPRETVLKDFIKTNEFLRTETDRTVESVRNATGDRGAADCARVLCEVRESYLTGVFEVIDEKFETMERYAEEMLGVTREQQDSIRKKYLI